MKLDGEAQVDWYEAYADICGEWELNKRSSILMAIRTSAE
jgi:hypothetical protein